MGNALESVGGAARGSVVSLSRVREALYGHGHNRRRVRETKKRKEREKREREREREKEKDRREGKGKGKAGRTVAKKRAARRGMHRRFVSVRRPRQECEA